MRQSHKDSGLQTQTARAISSRVTGRRNRLASASAEIGRTRVGALRLRRPPPASTDRSRVAAAAGESVCCRFRLRRLVLVRVVAGV